MNTTLHPHRNALYAWSAVAALLLASCADDPFGKNSAQCYGNDIVFSVTDGSEPDSSSRSVSPGGSYAGTSALTAAGGDTLYLSAYSERGINLACRSDNTSRGTIADASTLANFGVYALRDDDTRYMTNVAVGNNDGIWTPDGRYTWPSSGSLRFYAYAPFASEASAEGITALPYFDADSAAYMLEYSVPQDIERQIDLMAAKPVSASASPCKITLDHKLAAIRFATGREMAPSVIKYIRLSGVKFKGTFDFDKNKWYVDSDTTSYKIDCNKELQRGSNEFVAPDTPLVGTPDDNMTLLLMPQTLGDDAKITLELEWNGDTYPFEASLKGKQWREGTTITYHLSANPGIPVLKLEVIDADTNMPLTEITPGWRGGKKNYQVISVYDPADGGPVVPIPWTATLVAPDGHEITEEDRKSETNIYHNIDYYDASGKGGWEDCRLITILPEPTFIGGQSAATDALRMAEKVGSETEPYNLAQLPIHQGDSNPKPNQDYNTSNCYVVNGPGYYSLPLVYGNAIVDGVYKSETHSGDKMEIPAGGLKSFINHLGDPISKAYIYEHEGCTPKGAKLLWTDQINVIRDVRLETVNKKPMLTFNVPATSIRQCNAVVAVTDEDGVVMWSWHIWVTSMKTNSIDEYIPINHTDNTGLHQHYLYHTNIGHIYAGDNVHFMSRPLIIKYRQQLPESLADRRMNPKEWEVYLQKADEDVSPVDYFLLYQWGRKDPFVPSIEKYYDENHNAIPVGKDTDNIHLIESDLDIKRLIAEGIKRPMANWVSLKNYQNFPRGFKLYGNLWNIEGARDEHGMENSYPYKSVYDPSPVGCKLPIGAVLELLVGMPYRWEKHYGSSDVPAGVFKINDDLDLFIFAAGYRDPAGIYNNTEEGIGSIRKWYIWEGSCNTTIFGGNAINGDNKQVLKTSYVFTSSLGVRPMHVEGAYY